MTAARHPPVMLLRDINTRLRRFLDSSELRRARVTCPRMWPSPWGSLIQACQSLASVAENHLPRPTLASYLRLFSPPRAAVRIHANNNSADSHPPQQGGARWQHATGRHKPPFLRVAQAGPCTSLDLCLPRTAEPADRVGPSAQ